MQDQFLFDFFQYGLAEKRRFSFQKNVKYIS